jgi:predicted HAD superfamily Cof-like phosphohydrolase
MTLSNYQATLDFIKIFDMFTVLPETYNGDMLQQHRDTAKLRYNLIHEEVTELREAIRDRDFVEVIDALTDILYVVYGAGATFGIDLEAGFQNYILNKGLVIPDKLKEMPENASHFTLVSSMNVNDFKIKSNFFSDETALGHVNSVLGSIDITLASLKSLLFDSVGPEKLEDSLHYLNFCVYSIGSTLQIDLDRSFDIVHKSNMSKVCDSEEIANQTVEWYKKNETRYDSPKAFASDTYPGKYLVRNANTGKALKSIHYTPADFRDMLM